MLDGFTYRLSQSLARRQISNWHLAQFHGVVFDNGPFPHGTQSLSELRQLMDTMQETRFNDYMRGMNGLTSADLNLLVDALTDSVMFQRTFMPDTAARVPYSTMMSALALFRKLEAYRPGFRTVLEIGPGCGYTSLFLKSYGDLENYTQIEACEGFYLLQNALNCFSFPGRFEERAFPAGGSIAANTFTTNRNFIEEVDTVSDPFPPKCIHLPWWRLGDLATGEIKFDIVTTNATLREMQSQALADYLEVIARSMNPDSVMISQCLGGEVITPNETLRDMLYKGGFAPLVYLDGGGFKIIVDPVTGEDVQIYLPIGLGVFVREGHPLFTRYYDRANYDSDFIAGEDFILRALYDPTVRRNGYREVEILEMVKVRFKSRLSS